MNPHDAAENDPRPTTTAHDHEKRLTTDAHANAHAHENVPNLHPFPHEKLDAYRVALELALLAKKIVDKIPRGHRNIADHLSRAASNTLLLLAEGANRRGAAQKRQRFVESRGECAEVAAAADLLVALEIGRRSEAGDLKALAGRVSAMLTKLIARLE